MWRFMLTPNGPWEYLWSSESSRLTPFSLLWIRECSDVALPEVRVPVVVSSWRHLSRQDLRCDLPHLCKVREGSSLCHGLWKPFTAFTMKSHTTLLLLRQVAQGCESDKPDSWSEQLQCWQSCTSCLFSLSLTIFDENHIYLSLT